MSLSMIHTNIDFDFIHDYLSDDKSKLVLTHENADPDAIGSAVVLKEHFPNLAVGVYKSLNKVSSKLVSFLDADVLVDPDPEKFEKLIVLDSSSPAQIGQLHQGKKEILVLDHHTPSWSWPKDTLFYIDESKKSLAEIIFQFFRHLILREKENERKGKEEWKDAVSSDGFQGVSLEIGNMLSRRDCLALLSGIVTDTGHFRHGDSHSLMTASLLLDAHGMELGEIFSLVNEEDELAISRKVAQLKAGQRLEFLVIKNRYILGYSEVGSFEGSACNKLLISGCDVVLIFSQEKNNFRISGRASYDLTKKGVHLGTIFLKRSSEKGWTAGGHPGAAGLSGEGDGRQALFDCVEAVKNVIETFG